LELIRTSVLTALSTGVKLVTAFAINKVLAVTVGPAGIATIGQLQNIQGILQGLTSGLVGNGAVKYAAEWKSDKKKLRPFLSLAFTLCLCASGVVGTLTVMLSKWLSEILLGSQGYWWAFSIIGFSLPFFALNSLLLAVITGLGDIPRLTRINIIQSVLTLFFSAGLPFVYGLNGAFIALGSNALVAFVAVVPELVRHDWLELVWKNTEAIRGNFLKLFSFSMMALASALCAPAAQLMVRSLAIQQCGETQAGYWQALSRFSGAYLVFFTTTLSVYFLPKFAALKGADVTTQVVRGYLLILPVVSGALGLIWFFRAQLIPVLFSDQFSGMNDLLQYQLFGDFLKVGCWMLSFVMLAKAKTWLFIGTEFGFAALYAVLSYVLLKNHDGEIADIKGALWAYIWTYFSYWLFLLGAYKYILCESK
jgi:PST family polysaccharide transporter